MKSLWYQSLNKSFLTPSTKFFSIAWVILYSLITLSFVIYIKAGLSKKDILPLILFFLGLILNFSWSFIFFVKHEILLAAFAIIGMIFLLIPVIILFYMKIKISGILLIPYLLWLFFALYLNFYTYFANKPN